MKLFRFALCVLLFVPGLTLAADDDGAGPSNRPASPPLSRTELLDRFLDSIVECRKKLKKAKAEKAKALAVTNNPTNAGAYVEGEKAFQSADLTIRLQSQRMDIRMADYHRIKKIRSCAKEESRLL